MIHIFKQDYRGDWVRVPTETAEFRRQVEAEDTSELWVKFDDLIALLPQTYAAGVDEGETKSK